MKIKKGIPEQKIPSGLPVGIDIEMWGLPDGKLHHPDKGEFGMMSATFDGKTVYYIDDEKDVEDFLSQLNLGLWIFQRGAFDITHLRRWALIPARMDKEQYWDTYLVEKLIWSGYWNKFALDDMARRYLEMPISKDIRSTFTGQKKPLTEEQIHYGCLDAVLNYEIYHKQRTIIDEISLNHWWDIENKAFWVYRDFAPIPFDAVGWENDLTKTKKFIQDFVTKNNAVKNWNSWQQVLKYLHKNNIMVANTNQTESLEPWLERNQDHPNKHIVEDLIAYRTVEHNRSHYGKNWLEAAVTIDNKTYIIPEWDTYKAVTGRPQAGSPAVQTIPPNMRAYIKAKKGYVLVVKDYSQQEPRISAFYSQDRNLISAFKKGGDIYTNVAQIVLGKTDISKEERRRFKAVVLGMLYGKHYTTYANDWNIPKAEAKQFVQTIEQKFPQVFAFLTDLEKNEFVTTLTGRKVWINKYSSSYKRNARNYPHQGGGADMKKLALILMWENWKFDTSFLVCLDNHDEIVAHCPKEIAEDLEQFIHKYMLKAAEMLCPGIPFAVDAHIVNNWKEAKGE